MTKTYKMPKTRRGADRQWTAILRAYRKVYAGGGSFGFDWPTMRWNDEVAYKHLMAIQYAFDTLPG